MDNAAKATLIHEKFGGDDDESVPITVVLSHFYLDARLSFAPSPFDS